MAAAVFLKFLQTGCRNDSNDMPLERYQRDTTFSCRTHSLIPYSLRAVLNILNRGILFLKNFKISVLFSLQFLNRLSKRGVRYAIGKLRMRRNFHILKYF